MPRTKRDYVVYSTRNTGSAVIPATTFAVKRARTTTSTKAKNVLQAGQRRAVKLPYFFEASKSAVSIGNQQYHTARGNGMYDPDYAAGGHQPMGYDQMTGLFDRWFVKSTEAVATIGTTDLSGNPIVLAALWADTTAAPPTSEAELVERCMASGGVTKTIVGATQAPHSCVILKKKFYTKSELGFGKEDDTVCGLKGSDPSKVYYIHACGFNTAVSGASTGIVVQLNLKYEAEFFDMADLTTS